MTAERLAEIRHRLAWVKGRGEEYAYCSDIGELLDRIDALTAERCAATAAACDVCSGSGEERSGVCHCGEDMGSPGPFAHAGHSPVEMTRPCSKCSTEARVRELTAERDKTRRWILAANKFAWAHERSCPRHDADAQCNCGLDQFLGRPRPYIESYEARIRELEAALAASEDARRALLEQRAAGGTRS